MDAAQTGGGGAGRAPGSRPRPSLHRGKVRDEGRDWFGLQPIALDSQATFLRLYT